MILTDSSDVLPPSGDEAAQRSRSPAADNLSLSSTTVVRSVCSGIVSQRGLAIAPTTPLGTSHSAPHRHPTQPFPLHQPAFGSLNFVPNLDEFNTSFWGRSPPHEPRANHSISWFSATQKPRLESGLTAELNGRRLDLVLTDPLQDGRCSDVLASVARRSPPLPLSAPLAQPDTAILLNLSLSTKNLSGRLTVSQTWMNSTLHSGGDSLRDGKAERTPTSHVQTTLYLGSQRLKNLDSKAS